MGNSVGRVQKLITNIFSKFQQIVIFQIFGLINRHYKDYHIIYISLSMKQFVKAKPLGQPKEKQPPPHQRQSKKYNKKYEEKSFQQEKDVRQHIKFILSEFKPMEKISTVSQLIKRFPSIFSERSLKPQPQLIGNFTDFLWFKKQVASKPSKPISSDSSEPDWNSDQEKQINLASKKIDDNIVEKVNNFSSKQPSKKLDQLQRHEKQFLEDYYRQKRHENQNGNASDQKDQEEKGKGKEQTKEKNQKETEKAQHKEEDSDWAEYDPNVGALITGGFIEKIEKGGEDDFEMDEDFSYQSQKSHESSSSSDADDDMFADEGPRTVIKTKEDKHHHDYETKHDNKAIVQISSHLFSQIAEQIGIHPDACVWIISNKIERYRVSTQYMNQYYKNGGLSTAFPYVSFNHSQFVHSDEIQTEKALEKFKRYHSHRRHKNHKNYNGNQMNHSNQNKVVKPQPPHYKQKK